MQSVRIQHTCALQGVKVSISQAALPKISALDCDILHLLRTTEKLQDQLEVMDQRCEM